MNSIRYKHANLSVFLPQEGCPYQCVFCDQNRTSGTKNGEGKLTLELVREQIERQLSTRAMRDCQIAYFGGTFTGIAHNRRMELLRLANRYVKAGLVSGIRISTRPDLVSDEIVSELAAEGVTHIELGAQSLSDEVLDKSGRGYTFADIQRASTAIRGAGLSLGIQLMPGLPGETQAHQAETSLRLLSLHPHEARLYPTLVIEGTQLSEWYRQGRYSPMSIDAAVETCAALQNTMEEAGIRVLRVGLAEADGLARVVVAGPYHPAFGELVRSHILRGQIALAMQTLQVSSGDSVCIEVPQPLISQAIGHNRANKAWLKQQYPDVQFRFVALACDRIEVRKEVYERTACKSNSRCHF